MTVVLNNSTAVTTARSVQVAKPAAWLLLLGESLLKSEIQSIKIKKGERLCVNKLCSLSDLVKLCNHIAYSTQIDKLRQAN